jgi:eukaryotic-like serine/threonine-protein kinase
MVDSPSARPEPARLGRYVLLDEIASGGMATVYLARLEGLEGFQRTCAIKRPHPHLARNTDAVTMFLDEARMAARIRHVNVVPTLDVLDEGGQVALVMEYVEGEPLSGLMQLAWEADVEVPLRVAARIASDVLEGLHAAHEVRGDDGALLGLVHRDVSPHNVLVGVDGLARVVDFGIAKAEGRMYQTAESGVKGKLGYVAPEYLAHGQLDRRSDLYATAVVLWELLAGRRLFMGRSEHEVMTRVLTLIVPPIGELRLDAPPALGAVIDRALSRDADQRFPDALEMARALRAAVPLAPNDEVGAWVKAIAADSLAARATSLARAEQSLAARANPGARPPEAQASPRRPMVSSVEVATPSGEPSGPVPNATPPLPLVAPRRSPWFVVTLAACMGVVGLSWVFLWREPPPVKGLVGAPTAIVTASAALAPAEAPNAPAPPESAARGPAPPAVDVEAVAEPPASDTERALPTSPASKGRGAPRTPLAPNAGRGRHPATSPKPPDTARPSCDPPYTYDNEGIRHFKPQCL